MGGRDDVSLTNLDQPLFEGARATKRDLVEYLEAVSEQLLDALRDRPLSVVRTVRGREPFIQKNVSKYAPPWLDPPPMARPSGPVPHHVATASPSTPLSRPAAARPACAARP